MTVKELKTNNMAFKLRSGNGPLKFKMMGSSPIKDNGNGDKTFEKVVRKHGYTNHNCPYYEPKLY